jgi:hypothetical protein
MEEEIHGEKNQWRKMSKVDEINWRKRSTEEKINGGRNQWATRSMEE